MNVEIRTMEEEMRYSFIVFVTSTLVLPFNTIEKKTQRPSDIYLKSHVWKVLFM